MKRIIPLVLLAVFTSCSLSAQKATLSGTLTVAILNEIVNDRLQPIDTLRLNKSGDFKLTLSPTAPTLYILQTDSRDGGICHLMVEPKDKINVDILYMPDQHVFKITQCKGSRNIELYRQFYDILLGAVNPTLQALVPQQIEQLLSKNKEVIMSAFLVTFFEQEFESHAALYAEIRDALIKKHPNDPYVTPLFDEVLGNNDACCCRAWKLPKSA